MLIGYRRLGFTVGTRESLRVCVDRGFTSISADG